ncbi:acetyltransferase [Fretibacterium sp. OH1220_COT-178]|uniref:acetyltransferase n=1 Tax=Fretibacterium sp. OH1220_COT-178 TaxID=2491047 RepID=UPI000F5DAFFE|nr:acetyltransferase [Fretibacterium sp. OH1220_COT-178]RRD65822.1 acetyltransferase [Fretibacterium sp. OH1220_COT-178]
MHDLVIYGAGGLGREIAEVVRRINEQHYVWNLLGFVDDVPHSGTIWRNLEVLGDIRFIRQFGKPLDVVLGIGAPSPKKRIYQKLKQCAHVHFPNVIDRTAQITAPARMGEGLVIFPMCFVSLNVALGHCVYLNTGAYVAHDSSIGSFGSVMPHASISGNVVIGEETLIGAGASILQGRTVGSRSTVGMGGIVIDDVPDDCVAVGNPAKPIRSPSKPNVSVNAESGGGLPCQDF